MFESSSITWKPFAKSCSSEEASLAAWKSTSSEERVVWSTSQHMGVSTQSPLLFTTRLWASANCRASDEVPLTMMPPGATAQVTKPFESRPASSSVRTLVSLEN